MIDFFISYNSKADSDWARWIAWQLEETGYTTVIQEWDFRPGNSWMYKMDKAINEASYILPILSESYFKSEQANSEWLSYQMKDSNCEERLIIPVQVSSCEKKGYLNNRIAINLSGITEAEEAIKKLKDGLHDLPKLKAEDKTSRGRSVGHRSKPTKPPIFPGAPASESKVVQKPIDYLSLKFLRALEGGEDELFAIAFSPDGRWVAAGSNGMVLLWDTVLLRDKTNPIPPQYIPMVTPTTSSDDHGKYVYSVAFSHDSLRLATGGEDGFVRVWDIDKKNFLWQEKRHEEAVYSVTFSPNKKWVASGSYDKHVFVWEVERGQLSRSSETDFSDVGRITSIAFSPVDGDMLAVGSLDDTVRLWDIRKGVARILGKHDSSVEGVAFSPDGRLLASCGLDKAVRVWDLQNTEEPQKWVMKKHEYLVRSVAFSPDGKTLASVGWDKTLILWEVETAYPFWTMPLRDRRPEHWHSDWVWSVAFAPGGMQLASSGSDARIICWQVEPM